MITPSLGLAAGVLLSRSVDVSDDPRRHIIAGATEMSESRQNSEELLTLVNDSNNARGHRT
jgi:hypothetical protein